MNYFSRLVSVFHERILPEQGFLAGYAALIEAYSLNVPLPESCSAISLHHKRYSVDKWEIYTPRYKPQATLAGHLTFALKYEGVDLAVLNALFTAIVPEDIEVWVKSEPLSRYSRRIWFFYEWLTEKKLNLPDAKTGNFFDAINPEQQYPGSTQLSKRHRIRNNLPGVRHFCPLVRCTQVLKGYEALQLNIIAHKEVQQAQHDLLVRASAFLLLKDSRASFQIENEDPELDRAQRWGKVLVQAGLQNLSKDELLRLQAIVLEPSRFITLGFRQEAGFIGAHDRRTGDPIPDHISAQAKDINILMDGIIATYQQLKEGPLDPVIIAAMIAFGFVFIHPFIDGNGRIHRYLIQHILVESKFVPRGIVFPISTIILERLDEYKEVLESYSRSALACVEWRSTNQGNVEVRNETIDLYRYFDATKQAEFLYKCMHQAIIKSFPEEIIYLQRYDRMKAMVKQQFSMPDHLISLLIRFLEQNNGFLSKRAKKKELSLLSPEECQKIEELYAAIFTS